MRFRFLAACRQRADDEDRYEKYLRLGRAVYLTGYFLSLGLILDSAKATWYTGELFDRSAIRILSSYVITLLLVLSWNGDRTFHQRLRRPHALFFLVGLLWLGAELTPGFIEWHPGELLGWWRASFLIAVATSGLLWASERRVQGLRHNMTRAVSSRSP